jgi:magnesium-transporting ATPase (P-type)
LFERIFVKDYLKNPFLWWGLTLFFLTKIDAYPPVNLILQTIVIRALYVPVLFICLAIAFFLAFYPIRKGLKRLLLKKEIKKFLTYYFLICLVLFVHVIYFFVGPYEIFSKLSPEFVTKKLEFEKSMDLTTLFETIAIPLLLAFTITNVKNGLLKEQCEIDDKFVKNLKFGGYVAVICALLYFLDIFITGLKQ